MIDAEAIREITMNRTILLKTASAILNGRILRQQGTARPMIVQEMAGQTASFESSVAKLKPIERRQLLASVSRLLERERRRCKARAGLYDAGRHISLYLAVKSIMQIEKRNPGERSPGLKH